MKGFYILQNVKCFLIITWVIEDRGNRDTVEIEIAGAKIAGRNSSNKSKGVVGT